MKIIESARYKKANSKKELALKLLEWHGGQASYLYSVGSSWFSEHDVPNESIEGAIFELNDELKRTKQSVNRIFSKEGWKEYENNINDLEWLIKSLKDEMKKEELFNNEDDINLNLINY